MVDDFRTVDGSNQYYGVYNYPIAPLALISPRVEESIIFSGMLFLKKNNSTLAWLVLSNPDHVIYSIFLYLSSK